MGILDEPEETKDKSNPEEPEDEFWEEDHCLAISHIEIEPTEAEACNMMRLGSDSEASASTTNVFF